jgi:hypothetical protein
MCLVNTAAAGAAGFTSVGIRTNAHHRLGSANAIEVFAGGLVVGGGGGGLAVVDLGQIGGVAMKLSVHKSQVSFMSHITHHVICFTSYASRPIRNSRSLISSECHWQKVYLAGTYCRAMVEWLVSRYFKQALHWLFFDNGFVFIRNIFMLIYRKVWDTQLQELCSFDIGSSSTRVLCVSPLIPSSLHHPGRAADSVGIQVFCSDGIFIIGPKSSRTSSAADDSEGAQISKRLSASNLHTHNNGLLSQKVSSPSPSSSHTVNDTSFLLIPKLAESPITHACIASSSIQHATCMCVCDVTIVVGKSTGSFLLMTTLMTNEREAKVSHAHPIIAVETCRYFPSHSAQTLLSNFLTIYPTAPNSSHQLIHQAASSCGTPFHRSYGPRPPRILFGLTTIMSVDCDEMP